MSDIFVDDIIANTPSVAARSRIRNFYRNRGKRTLDLCIVVCGAPLAVPVVILIWLAMQFGGGNAFYGQDRIGKNGRVFRCWKIRSMAVGADALLATYLRTNPSVAAEWAKNQKLTNDPRITRLGAFLRRTSLDELPQLWNVLRGEMSLIGPRPFTPDQQDLYDHGQPNMPYYSLRPGLSGLWQVKARNIGTFQDRVVFDGAYERDLSFFADLKIALLTVSVVLRATGK